MKTRNSSGVTTTLCRTRVPRQPGGEIRRREVWEPPALNARPRGAVRGENQKQNVVSRPSWMPLGNDMASVSIVAPPPFFELYCTVIGRSRNGRYDLCCAGRLASKHALIAEKDEGTPRSPCEHPNGVHARNRRREPSNRKR